MKAIQFSCWFALFFLCSNATQAQTKSDFFNVMNQLEGTWIMNKDELKNDGFEGMETPPYLKWIIETKPDTIILDAYERRDASKSWEESGKQIMYFDAEKKGLVFENEGEIMATAKKVDDSSVTFDVIQGGSKLGEITFNPLSSSKFHMLLINYASDEGKPLDKPSGKVTMVWEKQKEK